MPLRVRRRSERDVTAQAHAAETLLVQAWIYGALIATGVLLWRDETRHRRDRAAADRHGRIDTTPIRPATPVHFTRDPSPKPRKRVDA